MTASPSRLLQSIDQSTRLAGHNRLALLLFRLRGQQSFGINVFKVLEVIPCPPLTAMPGTHPVICGMAAVRGRTIPVLDLSRAVGQVAAPDEGLGGYLIVAEFNRSVQAFRVHGVERIVHVDVADVRPPPREGAQDSYLTAVTRQNDDWIEIIDVERVLADVVGEPASVSAAMRHRGAGRAAPIQRILVADDSRVARSQIARTLEEIGFEALLVNDGRQALRMLQSLADNGPVAEQLLMVISDIEMPDMDGYHLTTEIRRDQRLAGLFVILHTSLSGIFNSAMVERVGADRFIPKFNADELAKAVLDHLQPQPA